MPPRSPAFRMWIEASELLDRAERLQRRFFQLGAETPQPCWEPPCDVIETDDGLFIEIALPGVDPAGLEASFVPGGLVIAGERRPHAAMRRAVVRRLELPPGRYELVQRELSEGCLKLSLRKLA